MLQQEKPEDFVIATGVKRSVRDFIDHAANFIGLEISWLGEDESEVGIVKSVNNGIFKEKVGNFSSNFLINKKIVKVDSSYYRPTEVNMLLGDASKARKKLKWTPKRDILYLVKDMIEYELNEIR